MEAGVLSKNEFFTVLRTLAQKKRQGMLELLFPDQKIMMSFLGGKIVEVADSVHGLQEEKYRIVETLYALHWEQKAEYQFRPQVVELVHEGALSVSPGELILDMIALEGDKEEERKKIEEENKRENSKANLANFVSQIDKAIDSAYEDEMQYAKGKTKIRERSKDNFEKEENNNIPGTDFHSRFASMNAQLLRSGSVPRILAYVFILWSLLAPLLFWSEAVFGRF